jgi:hypothetical protein
LAWSYPHDALLEFALAKKIMERQYVALDEEISTDVERPTIFDAVDQITIAKGDVLFDIVRWQTKVAGTESSMTLRAQAAGFIKGNAFIGSFQSEFDSIFPSVPGLRLKLVGLGTFEVLLDPR